MNSPPSFARGRKAQSGAAAIEFALLFTIFFAVFYAILGYAFVTLLSQGLVQAAAEGARSVLMLQRTSYATPAAYIADAAPLAKAAALKTLDWMPAAAKSIISSNGVSTVESVQKVALPSGASINVIYVTVTVKYANYAANPIIPVLVLPQIGAIPQVPTDLVGTSTIRI